jgi:hypothetical protein
MEVKGKVICKKADNRAFKLGDDWYNCNDNVIASLEKIGKGEEVTVVYEKKGVSRYVSSITVGGASAAPSAAEAPKSSTGFACEVCGASLKDGKYKKCFKCNKSGATKSGAAKEEKKGSYSPDAVAGIQRGNALNAAGAVASSQQFASPVAAKEFTLILADEFLQWLRAE